MKAELIDHMGDDRTVVNAARVSFDKESKEFSEKDAKLIQFLAKHKHVVPFAHPQLSFRCNAPIFVARQLAKHQVGFVWNEVSRRYVDYEPTFYEPTQWRTRAINKKQGSGEPVEKKENELLILAYRVLSKQISMAYNELVKVGIAPEQARMLLPLNTYTSWIWTGSLLGFIRVCQLRLQQDAQEETRMLVTQIASEVKRLFPASWLAFFPEEKNA